MVAELLLGDNPFIGVSHLAQEKAREEIAEGEIENKLAVFEAAVEGGATGFTFSTHPRNLELLTYLEDRRPDLIRHMSYYVVVPYAEAYVRKANMRGTPELLRSALAGLFSWRLVPDVAFALASSKFENLVGLFIQAELAPYLNVLPRPNVRAILLHEIATDPLIAFGRADLLSSLAARINSALGLNFGIHTRNFGHTCRLMYEWDSVEYVMTPINCLGHMMSPTRAAVEQAIHESSRRAKIIAINTMASGALNLGQSIEYLRELKHEIYAVTSASTKVDRIRENFRRLAAALLC
jgi:hypothetical protein